MTRTPSEIATLLFDENHQELVTTVLKEHEEMLDTNEYTVFISRYTCNTHTKKKKAEDYFIANLDAFNNEAMKAHAKLGERIQELNLEVKHFQEKWKNTSINFESEALQVDFKRVILKKTKSLLSEFSGNLMYRLGEEITISHGDLKDRLNPSYFIRWKFYFTYSLTSSKYTAKETGSRTLREDRHRILKCVESDNTRNLNKNEVHISFQLGRKKTKEAVIYLSKDFKTWKLYYKKDKEMGWQLESKTDRFSLFNGM
jgi:hypothetical protein